jgi:predicted ATPase
LGEPLDGQSHYRIHYQCSPYHTDSALYPVIQQLTRAATFDIGDSDDTRLDKLEALLGLVPDQAVQSAPLLADLLGIDGTQRYGALKLTPQQQRPRTLQALIAQLTGLARHQPVLFVVEDAHWIDPTTLELIGLALDVLSQSKILLLITARPTFEHRFGGHPSFTRLVLNRLRREPVLAIIERLSGGKALPEELVDEIIRKTDGMPLFVEEITKAMLESGQLRDAGDTYVLDAPLRTLDIPSSLNDSLMARLDRLQPVREVTQMAACIGREFSHRLLVDIAQVDEHQLQTALEQLIDAELVFRRGTPPEASYTFKHALVRDAAYASLLKSRRQQLHARVLAALEAMSGSAPELLARHAAEAGLIEQAIQYWQQAGEQATRRSANAEASSQLSQAIGLLDRLPASDRRDELELTLQVRLSASLYAAEGFTSPKVTAANERAYALCRQIGQTPKIIPSLSNLQRYYLITCELPRALEISRELHRLRQRFSDIDPAWHAIVDNSVGISALMTGDFETARQFEQQGVEHSDVCYRETQILVFGTDMGVTCRVFLAIAQWCLGYPDQARATLDDARVRAGQFSHAFSSAVINTNSMYVLKFLDAVEVIRERATASYAFAVEHCLPSLEYYNLLWQNWALARQEPGPAVISRMEQTIMAFESNDIRYFNGYHRSFLAEAYQAAGRLVDAIRVIDETLDLTERSGDGVCRAELYRLKGEFLLQQASPDAAGEAEACFQQALAIARNQQARSWELRSATSLARLWRDQGRQQEARALLAPVYDWFSEGFETPDLKNARALLDELA